MSKKSSSSRSQNLAWKKNTCISPKGIQYSTAWFGDNRSNFTELICTSTAATGGPAKPLRFLRYYPTVLSLRNGEFPPLLRLKNFILSILAAPFLVTPYIVALRHSRIEREGINLFSRLLLGGERSSFSS